jgi:isoleucyl-tRNA synthetase
MAFEKVDTRVDFPAQERRILDLWRRTEAFERLRQKNRGGPRWSFLDGPITANNPMGVHHAWGRTYKDAFQRYHAMSGQELRYQNGFDCQGLWVEVEVEKELKLNSKRDIENLVPGDTFASIDRFVRLCKERVDKYARIQTEQSVRLGYWIDWDRPEDFARPPDLRRSYYTMSEENNYTIWSFLRKCHDRGLVYKAYDAMPWCPRCSVGLSQMEMNEGYQLVAHRAVFARFPLRGRPGENLLIWTTTPWTLTSNVAAAVNPDLTYLKVLHKDQTYYVARGAFTAQRLEDEFKNKSKERPTWVPGVPRLKSLEQVFKEKGGYEIAGELPGSAMVGWEYDGPFDELPAQAHPAGYPAEIACVVRAQNWAPVTPARDAHRVVAWEDVGEREGTGIVHIAPGCGREDFLLGREQGLPPVAPLDDYGNFLPGFGPLTGRSAVDHATTDAILDDLQRKGVLFAVERYPHSYPHCWRCKTELLFRLVDEWFIGMSWRSEIMDAVRQARWLPESINGQARELDWLTNMGDWMISKKRFWGLALPIWVDEVTGDFEVIGSCEELRARAVEGWDRFEGHSPHRPWIDLVKIRNPKTGNLMSRIPDVGNPWLDAGIVPFSTMRYNTDRAYWEKWFPADFVTESFPGQFRNWFYALLAMSTMMVNRAPFKVLLGHGQVRDQWGEEMHKSRGNAIPFEGAADDGYTIRDPRGHLLRCPPMGADVIRWLYCRHNPAQNVNFGPTPAEEIRAKFFLKLWNTYAFFCNYASAKKGGFDPGTPAVPVKERPELDRWILSELQKLIRTARRAFDEYSLMDLCQETERFVDGKLSNWYVRRSRDRFQASEPSPEKLAAFQTLHTVLVTLTKLLAPVIPFLTEEMYQNLVTGTDAPGSVHLCRYPKADDTLVDVRLSADVDGLLDVVSLGHAARNAARVRVRQPLAELKVYPAGNDSHRRAAERFPDQLSEELNVKWVTLADGPLLKPEIKPNPKSLGPKFGPRLAEVQKAVAATPPATLAELIQAGKPFELSGPGGPLALESGDFFVQMKAPEGWAGVADRGTEVLLDVRLTEELRREGTARDVVRQVQEQRKSAKLEMEDRIALYLATESEPLRKAIDAHRDYIAGETLATSWAAGPLNGQAHRATVQVEGQPLTIELARVGTS